MRRQATRVGRVHLGIRQLRVRHRLHDEGSMKRWGYDGYGRKVVATTPSCRALASRTYSAEGRTWDTALGIDAADRTVPWIDMIELVDHAGRRREVSEHSRWTARRHRSRPGVSLCVERPTDLSP